MLNIGERRRSVNRFPPLEGLPFLRRLSIVETGISDISPLSALPNLTGLNLSRTPVWDISTLSSLMELTHLDLSFTNVVDLRPLAGLRKLRSLDLTATAVTDLAPISGLLSLKFLDARNTKINDITAVTDLVGLLDLDLNHTSVSNLQPLAGLRELRRLNLVKTSVRDLSCLAGLVGLGSINLASTKIEDVSSFAELKNLAFVDLSDTHVRNIEALRGLRLQRLQLKGSRVTDLAPLVEMKSLAIATQSGRHYRPGGGLSFANCPIADQTLAGISKIADREKRTLAALNYLRQQRGLSQWDKSDFSKDSDFEPFNRVKPLENVPSPYAFDVSLSGNIALVTSVSNIPFFPNAAGEKSHKNRLEVCRTLADDLISDLEAQKFQARSEYSEGLRRYEARLPADSTNGNILLADAEARTLRSLFAVEASFLSVGFASKLKTFLEQHIGLRVFYPEISHFYRDVQSGKLQAPLPLDAAEGFIEQIRANTPNVFDESVLDAIEGSAEGDAAPTTADATPSSPNLDVDQPLPPRDPLGELDPQKTREFTFAGAANGLWRAFLQGEKINKSVEGWSHAGEKIYPHVTQIIEWLRQFLRRATGGLRRHLCSESRSYPNQLADGTHHPCLRALFFFRVG